jgi:serine/threonine protein kinase/tetratricopeptide (TPR) repeat protein
MTSKREQQIETLFLAAREFSSDRRDAYLSQACGEDEELRSEVLSRLSRYDSNERLLDRSVLNVPGHSRSRVDETISHFRLLSLLGKGGMGEVYLAEDLRLGRKVALKLLPTEFIDDGEWLRRFKQEAQAASALNHPNIIIIYEVDQAEGHPFTVMEYVEGETLRALGKPMPLQAALDLVVQITSALAAAHAQGIIHRDIKPENIMVRPDGLVKVLDFGLAKLARPGKQADASQISLLTTQSGMVIGTPRYMSPEQARGEKLDGRSDLFSLGIILYELVTGRQPFKGRTMLDAVAAMLQNDPEPLGIEVPPVLESIILRSLAKVPEDRYPSAAEMLADLTKLRQQLPEQSAKVNIAPSAQATENTGRHAAIADTGRQKQQYTAVMTRRPQSRALWRPAALLLAGLIAIAGAGGFYFTRSKPVLTDKDSILLADIVNKTGEEVFDLTLRQGLAVQLRQSPFLDLFPDARIRATLQMMGHSPEDRVSREIGREICQRQGLKAFITGAVAKFDRNYSITLEAINSQTGDSIALTQVEAEGKDQVLKALSRAASELREKLGESLTSLQKFDAQLQVTTSSLDALKDYALGSRENLRGNFQQAIVDFRRSLERDPNCATAWNALAVAYLNVGQPRMGAECSAKAFSLRDRVSEFERIRIMAYYYVQVTGEMEKAIEKYETYGRNYPRDHLAPGNLSDFYNRVGQYEKAIAMAQSALQLNPNTMPWYWNQADSLLRLNRFAEAWQVCQRAIEMNLDHSLIRELLCQIAFVNNDAAAIQEQIAWMTNKSDAYRMLNLQAQSAAFAGQWRHSLERSRLAVELANRGNVKETAAQYQAETALRAAVLGQAKEAVTGAKAALKLERNIVIRTRAALALAIAGNSSRALALADELQKEYPVDTFVNQVWLPLIRAAVELGKGNAQPALDLLQPTKRLEAMAEFWPRYLRGQAYLELKKGGEAAAEFHAILDHRGEGVLSPLFPLAHLGAARGAMMNGDPTTAQRLSKEFFTLWKDADPDLPALKQARSEAAR